MPSSRWRRGRPTRTWTWMTTTTMTRWRGEKVMDEGYADNKGGRRWGGKGGGRASGRATTVVAAPITNEVLVANLGKIADK